MNPELGAFEPSTRDQSRQQRELPRPVPTAQHLPTSRDSDEVDALSTASVQYNRKERHRSKGTRRPSVALALLVSLLIGAGVFLAGRLHYRCIATFAVADALDPTARDAIRKDLLDHAWHKLHDEAMADIVLAWFLDAPQANSLRISLLSSDRERSVAALNALATSFLDELRRKTAADRQAPTKAEEVLSDYADRLTEELANAEAQVESAMAALPTDDPIERRDELLGHWQDVRSRFDATRDELSRASSSLVLLHDQADPTHGIVSSEERHGELEGDKSLQADLRELAVNLAEVKLHLVNVGVRAEPLLTGLRAADQSLYEVLAGVDRAGLTSPMRDALDRLAAEASQYRDALQSFATAWDHAITTLRERDVDPMSGEVLDLYRACVDRLNEFLFASARYLTAMRKHVGTFGQAMSDNARHHVVQSNVVRAFHKMQTAHHRFEFSAGRIAGTDDFRLDAARRSALGLRRRTRERIRSIDQRLQEQAVVRAREQRQRDLAAAEAMVERIRSATDKTVDDLVGLQGRLNATVANSEAFQAALGGLEVATGRLEVTRGHLEETESRLNRLESERLATDDDISVMLSSCGVVGGPINLSERLRSGAITAAVVFIAMMLGQWWVTRRG